MIQTAAPQISQKAQLPVATSTESVVHGGLKHTILKFEGCVGPTMAESMEIAKARGKEMLIQKDAERIRDDKESNEAFRKVLKPEEWSFLINPELEKWCWSACLIHQWDRNLFVGLHYKPGDTARALILKENGSEEARPESALRA